MQNSLPCSKPYPEHINWLQPTEIIVAIKQYKRFCRLIHSFNGGLDKAIDETRELLEDIYKEHPDFLIQNWWVLNNIKAHDEYLCEILNTFPEDHYQVLHKTYKREWPSHIEEEINKLRVEEVNKLRVENSKPLGQETQVTLPEVQTTKVGNNGNQDYSLHSINQHYQKQLSRQVNSISEKLNQIPNLATQHHDLLLAMQEIKEMMEIWSNINTLLKPTSNT